ncbi:MAG: hypothetical protein EAZ27_05815 [Cytophagales bacterium]|nr:MAG: hypothetical protein EAZ27_05815 [Cytophagales bacterium]
MYENINPMNKSTAIFEILILLIGAAILGFILAWLLFRNKTEHAYTPPVDSEEIEKLKKKNNDLMIELGNVKRSNTDLSIKLDDCNKRGISSPKASVSSKVESVDLNLSVPNFAAKPKPDDLKIIEGIGPKIEELLNNGKIFTFSDLANANFETLKTILVNAGSRFQMHDPTTWPQQSALARDGKFEELKKLQDELNAGKA